ncbi:MAG: PDZ domain-containing protein [Betaproteobacteria bacterium]
MRRTAFRFVVLAGLALVATAPSAQSADGARADPRTILAAAKSASGGEAWDVLKTQHSKVTLSTSGLTGTAERWADMAAGRSLLRYELGPIRGAVGYDGTVAWSEDASGLSRAETDAGPRELAVNAAYRDRLAFWYPDRGAAEMEYRGVAEDDGAEFDVVRITPAGGRLFELWVNRQTHLIERLLERDAQQTRTEHYMDFRAVQGVQIPFRVRSTRGDPKFDELVVVDALEYNRQQDGIAFGLPAPPRPDFAFPAGKSTVEVPLEVRNGHLFIRVTLNGKGPYRMLLDAGGANVLMPSVVAALRLSPGGGPSATGGAQPDVALTTVDKMDVGGIVLDGQAFATLDFGALVRRVEGLDDVAGLVGFELLKRFPVTLDYARSRAIFHNPATFRYAGNGTRVPIRFDGRIPAVDGSVDGVDGTFDIDTGNRGSLTLTSAFVQRNGLVAKYGATQDVISGAGAGGHLRSLLARAGVLKLGTVEVGKPVTALSRQAQEAYANPDLAGSVGYGVLRQFSVTFDYASEALYFERNANYGQPDVHERAGMWIERGAKGYEVVDVVAGGPAARAGLKAGDVIVAVNGKAPAAMPLDQVRAALKAAPGTKLSLKFASGSVKVITLRDLI